MDVAINDRMSPVNIGIVDNNLWAAVYVTRECPVINDSFHALIKQDNTIIQQISVIGTGVINHDLTSQLPHTPKVLYGNFHGDLGILTLVWDQDPVYYDLIASYEGEFREFDGAPIERLSAIVNRGESFDWKTEGF